MTVRSEKGGMGRSRRLSGMAGDFPSTVVPEVMMAGLKSDPIPITISGTNNVTFTIGVCNLWCGNDFISLDENLTYTWTDGANVILTATTGAQTTLTASTLGIWYFYISYDDNGALALYPSQDAPSFVDGVYPAGRRSNPGTARERFYTYVGFMLCTTAATPVFMAMVKIGYQYGVTWANRWTRVTPGTAAAVTGFTGADQLPAHGALGLTVGGVLETAAGVGDIAHIAHNTDGIGEIRALGAQASLVVWQNFKGIPTTAAGDVVTWHTAAEGDVHLTNIEDIV